MRERKEKVIQKDIINGDLTVIKIPWTSKHTKVTPEFP